MDLYEELLNEDFDLDEPQANTPADFSSILESIDNLSAKDRVALKERCDDCNEIFIKVEYDLMCQKCGVVVQGVNSPEFVTDDDPKTLNYRLAGANAFLYQSNMYKSSTSNYAATQMIHNERTFRNCTNRYIEQGKRLPFPQNVCARSAKLFLEVQKHCIRRSENRHLIMASCLYFAGIEMGSLPPIQEIADFMQLETRGISKGINFLRELKSEGKISFDPNQSIASAKIKTLFDYLKITDSKLSAAIMDIIDTMKVKNIGSSLHMETKVIGATFCALLRCPTLEERISMTEFCSKCNTRKNSVSSIYNMLTDYHSHFEQVYLAHDLVSDRFID